jgi:hypothetical protein
MPLSFAQLMKSATDEEVAREAHLGDHADLELGLLAHVVGDAVGVAERRPFSTSLTSQESSFSPGRAGEAAA